MANNLSFETAGTVQGTASLWSVVIATVRESIGIFNAVFSGPTLIAWDFAESYERGFYLPAYVHSAADTVHVVTSPDASVPSDWPSVYTLLAELVLDFRNHVLTTGVIHLSVDETILPLLYAMSSPTTPVEAQGYITLLSQCLYCDSTSSSRPPVALPFGHLSAAPAVHRKEDVLNHPLLPWPPIPDLSLCVAGANELKAKYNAHIAETHYGSSNESSTLYLNDISHVDLPAREVGLVRDLSYEGFERGWSIPSIATSGKIDDQRDLIDMDDPGGSASIWGIGIWGSGVWGGGVVSWPSGHEHFLDSWGLLRSQSGSPAGEAFELNWKLPGSHAHPTNNEFKTKYYDPTVGADEITVHSYSSLTCRFLAATQRILIARIANPDGTWKARFSAVDIGMTLTFSGTVSNNRTFKIAGVPYAANTYGYDILEIAVTHVSSSANWKGAWSSGNTYGLYDEVSYGGRSYTALQGDNIGHQPDTNPPWWTLIGDVVEEPAIGCSAVLKMKNTAWVFSEIAQLQTGIVETFNSGWKDCQIGATKYWSGTEWRFVETPLLPDRQLFASGMGSYKVTGYESYGGIDTWGFGSFDIGDPGSSSYADPLPDYLGYSPDVCVKIISGVGISGAAIVLVNFVNAVGAADSCYVVLDGTEVAGDYLFQCFAQTPSLSAPRYHFWQKWSGMRQVTSISVVSGGTGTFAIRGYLGYLDTFEGEDWTLTLTI